MIADHERMIKTAWHGQHVPDAGRVLDLAALGENSGLRRIIADLGRSREGARLGAGLFEELRQAGVFGQGALISPELEQRQAWLRSRRGFICRESGKQCRF